MSITEAELEVERAASEVSRAAHARRLANERLKDAIARAYIAFLKSNGTHAGVQVDVTKTTETMERDANGVLRTVKHTETFTGHFAIWRENEQCYFFKQKKNGEPGAVPQIILWILNGRAVFHKGWAFAEREDEIDEEGARK